MMVWVASPEGCGDEAVTQEAVQNMKVDEELRDHLVSLGGKQGLETYVLPNSYDFKNIPQDPKNPLNSFKVLLGKQLFCEPALSIKTKFTSEAKTVSCATCHVPSACFTPGIKQGIGEGGQGFGTYGEARVVSPGFIVDSLDVQTVTSPSIMNSAFNRTSLWDGALGANGPNKGTEDKWDPARAVAHNNLGFDGVETQAIVGMKNHRMDIDPEFVKNNYYKEWFDLAFPEKKEEERYTLETAALAIAAFERTVIANKAPFQKWLKGDANAMTENQKLGALLFFGKAKCNNCHDGPALNSEDFHALGMDDFDPEELPIPKIEDWENKRKGRANLTKDSLDLFKFKTPQLYGLKRAGFYGHGGSFESVEEIIRYKNLAVSENDSVAAKHLSPLFVPLGLTEDEIGQLTDFVENALDDSDMSRYTPDKVASDFCFPNNDAHSRADLGCE